MKQTSVRPTPLELAAVMPENWVPLSWRLNTDWADWAKQTWPTLYINQSKVVNAVSRTDPLGALPALVFDHDSDNHTVKITLHGESSPWLEPQALETYALIQWPDTFRRGKNGQAPE